jgi:hypothetical protein
MLEFATGDVPLSLFLVQNTNVLAFWDKSSLAATHALRVESVAQGTDILPSPSRYLA